MRAIPFLAHFFKGECRFFFTENSAVNAILAGISKPKTKLENRQRSNLELTTDNSA